MVRHLVKLTEPKIIFVCESADNCDIETVMIIAILIIIKKCSYNKFLTCYN